MINATIFIDTGKISPSTGFIVENWLQADMSTASIVLKDSIKKAKDINLMPSTSLESGLKATMKWHNENR